MNYKNYLSLFDYNIEFISKNTIIKKIFNEYLSLNHFKKTRKKKFQIEFIHIKNQKLKIKLFPEFLSDDLSPYFSFSSKDKNNFHQNGFFHLTTNKNKSVCYFTETFSNNTVLFFNMIFLPVLVFIAEALTNSILLHSALVQSPDKKNVLILAPSNYGKTTLSFMLFYFKNYTILSDDMCFIKKNLNIQPVFNIPRLRINKQLLSSLFTKNIFLYDKKYKKWLCADLNNQSGQIVKPDSLIILSKKKNIYKQKLTNKKMFLFLTKSNFQIYSFLKRKEKLDYFLNLSQIKQKFLFSCSDNLYNLKKYLEKAKWI